LTESLKKIDVGGRKDNKESFAQLYFKLISVDY